jgi:hypothetical protein
MAGRGRALARRVYSGCRVARLARRCAPSLPAAAL